MNRFVVAFSVALLMMLAQNICAEQVCDIQDAILLEKNPVTPQLSTNELKKAIKEGALLVDNRPYKEWAISHIPGAIVVGPKPGTSKALYTSDEEEIKRLVQESGKAVILYCDGIYCGKSKRVAEALLKAGVSKVYRYQLGIPIWRSLGNPTQCELDGIKYIYQNDKTAWFIDSRKAELFAKGSLKTAKNIPSDGVLDGKDVGEIFKAKNDGRLPVDDRNTRIVVFGSNEQEVKRVAEALTKEGFHNVCFYAGDVKDILKLDEEK
jgi:rhodanese-related sulfurtransferase